MNENRRKYQEIIQNVTSGLNLLVLNGKLEAARAGVHGKGFSVVFDEVKRLQEEIQYANTELNKLSVLENMKSTFELMEERILQEKDATSEFKQLEELTKEMKSLMKIKDEKKEERE